MFQEVIASGLLVAAAAVAGAVGQPLTAAFFESLGGAAVMAPDTMQSMAIGWLALGGVLIGIAAIQITGMVKAAGNGKEGGRKVKGQ